MRSRSLATGVFPSVSQPGVFLLPAGAQTILGSIIGTVKDATGAAVPGAAVTAQNIATGLTVKATSDNNGSYQIPNLPAGTYKVTFE